MYPCPPTVKADLVKSCCYVKCQQTYSVHTEAGLHNIIEKQKVNMEVAGISVPKFDDESLTIVVYM